MILVNVQCSKCGTLSEAFKETDSAGNTKYRIYEHCSCRDCFFDEVPSSPMIVQKNYAPGDSRYMRGNKR